MKYKSMFLLLGLLWSAHVRGGEQPSPYVGQEGREIRALSAEEVRSYLSGDGMGFAKAGELNHYPGPRHVLDLADALLLSNEQRSKTEEIFNAMNTQATDLGKQLVEKERLLDTRFAAGTISQEELQLLVDEIAELQGRVRMTHLQAHLAQRQILTADQVRDYDRLRGYHGPASAGQHGGH